MKKEDALEVRRQIFHALLGILIAYFVAVGFIDALVVFILIVAGIGISLLAKEIDIPVISWFLRNFERPEHLRKFPGKGAIFFLVGVFIVLALPFGRNTAAASIMILALGDSFSHVVGRYYGRIEHPLNRKIKLEGTVAGIFAGFLGAALFVPLPHAFLASLLAMIAEAVEFRINEREADDNIIVPVVAALAIFFLGLM